MVALSRYCHEGDANCSGEAIFREDVSIRIQPNGEDSRVDIRSSSRYFESDLGSNAARISKLIDDINTAADADNLKPVKKALPPSTKGPAKTVKK